jgi:hypothetical protein
LTSYYHWTDEETYKQITRKSNMIQRFMTWIFGLDPHDLVPGSGGRDEYGPGVYFTDSGPDLARSTIAGRCFGHSSSQDAVQCYFLVDFHGNAKLTKERAHVWLLSPKSNATQSLLDHGYHPDFNGEDDDDEYDDDDYDDDDYDYSAKCSNCNENLAAKGCAYGECGNCCDGSGCERHGSGGNDANRGPSCPECGDYDDISRRASYYYCMHCDIYLNEVAERNRGDKK